MVLVVVPILWTWISRQDRQVWLFRTSVQVYVKSSRNSRKIHGQTTVGGRNGAMTYKHASQTSHIGIKRCVVVLGEGLRNLFSRHDGRDIDKGECWQEYRQVALGPKWRKPAIYLAQYLVVSESWTSILCQFVR